METIAISAVVGIVLFAIGVSCGKSSPCECCTSWDISLKKLEYEQRKLDYDYYGYKQTFRYHQDLQREYQRGYFDGQKSLEYKACTPSGETVAKLLTTSMKTTQELAKELDVKLN